MGCLAPSFKPLADMNARATLTAVALIAALGLAGWNVATRYTFASGSRVWVEGTSTIHGWDCEAGRVNATMDATTASGAMNAISALTVTVPVAQMDCDNGTMNRKLRDALGTSPIQFTLTNANVGNVSNGRFGVRATGRLTIHGTTRNQTFTVIGRPLSNGRFRFTGEVPVTMSQFGVEPPRAMAGTLRTGDRVTVKFDVTAAR